MGKDQLINDLEVDLRLRIINYKGKLTLNQEMNLQNIMIGNDQEVDLRLKIVSYKGILT